MTIVKYKKWEFSVDVTTTQGIYNNILKGGAETCKCNDCNNYIAIRDRIFPEDVLKLFSELGIDYLKDSEIWHYGKSDDNLHIYGGCFHFIGTFSGQNCFVETNEGSHNLSLMPVSPSFSIGFSNPFSPTQSFFDHYDKENIVEINIQFLAPWIIDAEESE